MSVRDERHKDARPRQIRRFEDLSPPQVMALAIHIERCNAGRFRAFADAFRGYDEQVADRLVELAEEEDDHERQLLQAFAQLFGDEVPAVEENDVDVIIEAFDLADAEHQIFDSLEPIRVYELALRAEQMAQNFYLRAAQACQEPKLVQVYRQLAGMEESHVGWFEARIRAAHESGD